MIQVQLRLTHRGLGLGDLGPNRPDRGLGKIGSEFRGVEIALGDELLRRQFLRPLVLVLGVRDAMDDRGQGRIGYIQFSSQLDLGDRDPLWGRVWRGASGVLLPAREGS